MNSPRSKEVQCRLESPAAGAHETDLVNNDWGSIERNVAMNCRLHENRAAWPGHLNGLAQAGGRTCGLHNPVVGSDRKFRARDLCRDAGSFCNSQLLFVPPELMHPMSGSL